MVSHRPKSGQVAFARRPSSERHSRCFSSPTEALAATILNAAARVASLLGALPMWSDALSPDACRSKCVSCYMRSRSTLADPNAFPMCSRVLSLVKPFSNSGTAARNHVRFDQVRVNRTPFQPGSGSGHVRAQIHRPGTVSYLISIVCFGHLFNPDLDQAIFDIKLLASI